MALQQEDRDEPRRSWSFTGRQWGWVFWVESTVRLGVWVICDVPVVWHDWDWVCRVGGGAWSAASWGELCVAHRCLVLILLCRRRVIDGNVLRCTGEIANLEARRPVRQGSLWWERSGPKAGSRWNKGEGIDPTQIEEGERSALGLHLESEREVGMGSGFPSRSLIGVRVGRHWFWDYKDRVIPGAREVLNFLSLKCLWGQLRGNVELEREGWAGNEDLDLTSIQIVAEVVSILESLQNEEKQTL